jgi:iron complex outermembrane receptor protein
MPPELSAYQSSFFGRDDSARVEVAQPQSGGSVAAAWTGGGFSLDLHNRRFGRTTYISETNPSLDQTFHGKWITDLSASVRVRGKFRISATVSNMFDVYPDEWTDFSRGSAGIISFAGTVRYPAGHSPFGVNGRTIYFHLSYRD